MKIGVSLGRLNPSLWTDVTEEADRLGFESVWLPEHLVLPVAMTGSPHAGQDSPPIPSDVPVFDVFVALGFLAAKTERIRLGTRIYNVGLRHPFVSARAVATLDAMSGGRVELGIGAGWLEEEWDALGLDFHTRGRRTDEALEVCQKLWSERVIEHHGEFFEFGPVHFEPKPRQKGGPPLHIGGDGPAALHRAARFGTGWMPMNHSLKDLPGSIAKLAEECKRFGRSDRIEVSVMGEITAAEGLEQYEAAGVDRIIIRPGKRSSQALTGLHRLAADVLDDPKIK